MEPSTRSQARRAFFHSLRMVVTAAGSLLVLGVGQRELLGRSAGGQREDDQGERTKETLADQRRGPPLTRARFTIGDPVGQSFPANCEIG